MEITISSFVNDGVLDYYLGVRVTVMVSDVSGSET